MKQFLLQTLLLFVVLTTQAQKFTITGYVTDKKSGERLPGASISLVNLDAGTTTNNFGYYSVTLPETTVLLRITYVGYAPYTDSFYLNGDRTIHAALETIKVGDVATVRSSRKPDIQHRTQMSSIDLPVNTIKSLPAFLGEVDIMKAIQLLPGIQAGTEGSSGIYVRGGGPDQNLILLDGVPVYNVSHLFGFFSVFNADAINSVDVIKGGFPARYGGRLSSVIDIKMKEGNKNEFHGEGGIGLIASRLTLEGPLGKKKKSSFILSGRRTYADLLMAPIIKKQTDGETRAGYFFYDVNAKVNMELGKKDHLYFSGYFGNDKFYTRDEFTFPNGEKDIFKAGLKWGNITAVSRWNHIFNKKLFGNLTLHYSRYQFDVSAEETYKNATTRETFLAKYYSGIRDWSLRYDFDFLPRPNHFIKAGFSHTWHTFKPGAVQIKNQSSFENLDTLLRYRFYNTQEFDAYAEDDIRISPRLKANLGVHFTGYRVPGKTFTSLQPRVSARWLLNRDMSIKASYATMNQNIHLLTNSAVGLPTDLWVPVTARVPQQLSRQAALGWAWNYKNDYEISVEGYYKKMKNIIEYAEGASWLNVQSNWEDKVETGTGTSYGAEFFIQRKKGATTGMLGYTLSWSNRQFANLNFGKTFPYKFDRRHDFKVAVVHQLSKKVEISGEWVYGTGQAITLPIAVYQDNNGNEVEVYEGRNGFRMPAYHRLDLGIKFIKKKKKFERAWVIGIYNVYNRLNAFFIYRDYDDILDKPVFKKVTVFPIIPSISWQIKF
jgi:TonB dependent receptor/TonB-dependent Receptor Plug Domain/CarboxypepD_reg-like domain